MRAKTQLAKKTKAAKKVDYTYVEKNIYKTGSGTYRVRVSDNSFNATSLKAARIIKKIWIANMNSEPII